MRGYIQTACHTGLDPVSSLTKCPRSGLSFLLDPGIPDCVKTQFLSLRGAAGDVAIHYYQTLIRLLRFARNDFVEFSHGLIRRDDPNSGSHRNDGIRSHPLNVYSNSLTIINVIRWGIVPIFTDSLLSEFRSIYAIYGFYAVRYAGLNEILFVSTLTPTLGSGFLLRPTDYTHVVVSGQREVGYLL